MLRKSIIAAVILAALLLLAPHSASAQVRFGVTIGDPRYSYGPGYYSSYYPYSYPVYTGPTYVYPQFVYRYPVYPNHYVDPRYVYKYRRHHRRDDWDRRWRR
jgi:hypothetical protein